MPKNYNILLYKKYLILSFIFIFSSIYINCLNAQDLGYESKNLKSINYQCINYEIYCFKFKVDMSVSSIGVVTPVIKDLIIKHHPKSWKYYRIIAEIYDVTAVKDKKTNKNVGIRFSYQVRLRGRRYSCKIPLTNNNNMKDESTWIWGGSVKEEDHESWGKKNVDYTFKNPSLFENTKAFSGDTCIIKYNMPE